MSVDIASLQQWVGRERTLTDDLHPFRARALAAALNHPVLPEEGAELPLPWHWLYFQETPTGSGTGEDGHPANSELLPFTPLPRRMWAAGALRIERQLQLGRPASRRSVVTAVEAKSGRTGILVFVTLEHTLSQSGCLCIHEEQTLVYREMPSKPELRPPGETPPLNPTWSRVFHPNPVLLFRYSALTYNAHRIHYDRRYATEKEFYPSLVVHAPLIATLLLDLVRVEAPDTTITSFRFRAVRPTFDTHPFTVCGARDGEQIRLWTADHDGNLCMSAWAS